MHKDIIKIYKYWNRMLKFIHQFYKVKKYKLIVDDV
jgi:hypothetical protein